MHHGGRNGIKIIAIIELKIPNTKSQMSDTRGILSATPLTGVPDTGLGEGNGKTSGLGVGVNKVVVCISSRVHIQPATSLDASAPTNTSISPLALKYWLPCNLGTVAPRYS